jgi:hypothetical protein
MRATPVNDAYRAANALAPSMSSTDRGQDGAENRPKADPSLVSVTSHSITLNTGSFSLDYTWRRVELAQDEAPASQTCNCAAAQEAPAKTTARPLPRPPQSFAEVLRRQQLSQLLLTPSRPPANAMPLAMPGQAATPPAPAQPKPVCRAYRRAMGPLAISSVCYSA